jgi:hypothetical protein
MEVTQPLLDERSELLVSDGVAALEASLSVGVPARRSGKRTVWDVLMDRLEVTDVRAALRDLMRGPGGELQPSSVGNIPFCSAESSALLAVNFLAPFVSRGGLMGAKRGVLSFERPLPVRGVRAPVAPHLDAVWEADDATWAFEFKAMEPWRDERKVSISAQYDTPAEAISPKMRVLLDELRSGRVRYRWLDAAQLIKHLLGIHSAVAAGVLSEPVTLMLAFWQPSDAGRHATLFEELDHEFADFAGRLDDQHVALLSKSTASFLDEWSMPNRPPWLIEHAECLRARYDPPLAANAKVARPAFQQWADRWMRLAVYRGRDVPHLSERIAEVARLWSEDVPLGWVRGEDPRLLDPSRRYLRMHRGDGEPRSGSEHELEHEILIEQPEELPATCLGARLVDGINAVPLVRDSATGGRVGNVEADMLLLTEDGAHHRLLLVEVKTGSNNAWYATVEVLRQLRLFMESASARAIMPQRHPGLPEELHVTAVVLAPPAFYQGDGAQGRAVRPAQLLIEATRLQFGIECRLASWNRDERRITEVPAAS